MEGRAVNLDTTLVRGMLKRRGLLAGAAGVLGAGIAKLSAPAPALAGHNTNIAYDSQTTMHLDVTNTTAGSTRISSNISGTAAFVALNNYPVGISRPDGMLGRTMYTTSNCAGVAGTCESTNKGMGVQGAAKAINGVGVFGYAGSVVPSDILPEGTGVCGKGNSFGTWGVARTGAGIGAYGESNTNAGVYGKAQSNAGVYGESTSGPGVLGLSGPNAGVYGQATSNTGVFGTSPIIGVYGISNGTGVWGDTSTGTGVFGQATNPAGFAAQFNGNVFVLGAFTVSGGPKSAAVPFPDGTQRRMYCQEAPEPWFEDFGRGKLAGGQAAIALASDFAAVVKTDDYLVFLTEVGDSTRLFVTKQTESGFVVQSKAGAKEGLFNYRIVARRRDLAPGRLEKVTLPKAPDRAQAPKPIDAKSFPVRPPSPDLTAAPSGPAAGDN
jgi:hypothetical protein